MIPSLFIGVPKTATKSICKAMEPHGLREVNFGNRDDMVGVAVDLGNEPAVTFHHAHVPTLIANGTLHPRHVERWFTFAFLRNPWDRMVSLYEYLFGTLERHHITEPGVNSFRDFVLRVTDTDKPIDPPGAYNWRGLSQCSPQAAWLVHEGRLQVDLLGRFERLELDWGFVCVTLGIPPSPLPHIGAIERRPYQEYYTRQLADRVGDFYAVDRLLGPYDFEKGLL